MPTVQGGEPAGSLYEGPTRASPGRPDPSRTVHPRRHRHAQTVIVVALGCGGVIGSVARYAISLALPTTTGQFPWGTFAVNVSGSALLGFILVLLIEQFPRGRLARPVVTTGLIGAYTTFSTYVLEAVLLARAGRIGIAALYVVSSVLVGLMAAWTGMLLARLILRAERWLQQELT